MHRIETEFAGRPLVLESGRLARQAAGSALLQFGDTVLLAAITVSPKETHLPFFPLTVEYREKTYAAGKFPGGFIKREGRPSDKEILAARVIDRTIRPLFPEGFKNEVQVFVTVVSADQQNDADVLGVVAASAALAASPVPWAGPVAAVRVGRVDATDGYDFGVARTVTQVEVVVSTTPSGLRGRVTDGEHAATPDAVIVGFDDDERKWGRAVVANTFMVRPVEDGTWSVDMLRPGAYRLVALPAAAVRGDDIGDPEYLRQLHPRGRTVVERAVTTAQ